MLNSGFLYSLGETSVGCTQKFRGWQLYPFLNYCGESDSATPVNGLDVDSNLHYDFNGSNQSMTINTIAEPNAVTFMAWVRYDDVTSAEQSIMSYYNSSTKFLVFYTTVGQKLHLSYQNGGVSTVGKFYANDFIRSEEWLHVGFSITGSTTVKIYLNGLPLTVITSLSGTRNTASSVHEYGGGSTALFFDGKIGAFDEFNRVLSDTEVLTSFNAQRSFYGV